MTHTHTWRRGIGGLVIVLMMLACVLVGGMSGIVAADSGPVFDNVTLSSSVVARGDTVTVSAHITDPNGDVLDAPTISFLLPDNADGPSIDFVLVSDTANEGRYAAAVLISPLLPTGRYVVKQLRAYDSAGNVTMIAPPDPRATGLTLTVVDRSSATATAAPAPATATPITAPTNTATANTATTIATSRATNTPAPATSTASRPTPTPMRAPVSTLVPTDGPGPDVPPTSTPTATVAARVTLVPIVIATATPTARVTPAATVTPHPATAIGAPAATATRPSAPQPVAATPTGTPAPFVSTVPGAVPVVVTLAVSSMTAVPGDTLIVTARISDVAADVVDFPTLRYRMPDGSDGPFAYLRRVDGTVRDGIYQAVIGLSPFAPTGAYTIKELTVTDLDGNHAVYVAPVPPQPGVTFVVQPFVPLSTALPADVG